MKTAQRGSSPLRGALTLTWDLNIRAIPTALVWAVSLLFLFQSPSLSTRVVCSLICSVVSLINTSIVKFSYKRVKVSDLIRNEEFKRIAAVNIFVGMLFVLALSNMLHFSEASLWFSVVLQSATLTLLILWMGLMLILNPIFVSKVAHNRTEPFPLIFMTYINSKKREVAITAAIVVVCAPLIFVFISIVLTLTQALSVIASDTLLEDEA
jgi:accessory gene regulator protein AgrB